MKGQMSTQEQALCSFVYDFYTEHEACIRKPYFTLTKEEFHEAISSNPAYAAFVFVAGMKSVLEPKQEEKIKTKCNWGRHWTGVVRADIPIDDEFDDEVEKIEVYFDPLTSKYAVREAKADNAT